MIYTTFVVRHGNLYCRFGSYGTVELVQSPLKATLYSRLKDACKRADQEHYGKYSNDKYTSADFRVEEISMTLVQ